MFYLIKKNLRLSVLNPEDRERKKVTLKTEMKKDLFDRLMTLVVDYESNFYGLR